MTFWCYHALVAAEIIQAFAGTNNVITLTIDGDAITMSAFSGYLAAGGGVEAWPRRWPRTILAGAGGVWPSLDSSGNGFDTDASDGLAELPYGLAGPCGHT